MGPSAALGGRATIPGKVRFLAFTRTEGVCRPQAIIEVELSSVTLREKSESAPLRPGVYIFKDDSGKPIYVGKAKCLRLRLRSYFQDSRTPDAKRDLMPEAASELETILVDNEKEAMALENNLIK